MMGDKRDKIIILYSDSKKISIWCVNTTFYRSFYPFFVATNWLMSSVRDEISIKGGSSHEMGVNLMMNHDVYVGIFDKNFSLDRKLLMICRSISI